MKRNLFATLVFVLFVLFAPLAVKAQAPVATPQEAITSLLNRIGGEGAADKFVIVIDANLAQDGKDVFVIAAQDGKPCIKGNSQLSVATGINWYLNHYAHINLTWNNLTTDLSAVELPVPQGEERHESTAKYRYDFNTCTFSYSMAFWTWERWQQEIDWMALHGINAPLNLVGLDVVTRKFLRELGVSESDINAYIAGPGFIAWFAMNNLEGWGGTINAKDVNMNGNPDWWYIRQEQLCRDMLQRMRELGMQPVIPGFSGQVPNCIVNYTIDGFSKGDVVNNGTWAGGYTRPDILKPNTASYRTFAEVYYKHLHEVMGVSEFYSIDPFHEGSLPSGVTNETCYPNIMVELDSYYNAVSADEKAKYNAPAQPKWIIQYWQGVPQSGAFSAMSKYGDRFIGLDLFADNIYAGNAAKWRTDYFNGRPYIYCMLHNFGGRSGLHGRLETTMNGYFEALAKNNNCQGVGATPEGIETNPILYDMLFELPWMDAVNRPSVDEWMAGYAHARYGVENSTALAALQNLRKSVWECTVNQQGTSEAVILARPNWTVRSVSSWSTSAIYWDTQDVRLAADQLASIEELVTTADGRANYDYDFIDVVRQAMVDYAAELLPLIDAARGNDAEYERLYRLYLQLMLDLDDMLSYDENFKLERWTSLARNIADEVSGTTVNDRNWLEWNARTQITVWSKGNTDLHDYSNRCWAGLIKDFHYKRWEKFFTTKGGSFSGGWFDGFEYPWTVDFTNYDYSTVAIPDDMTATAKAKQTFGKYFGRVVGKEKNYIFPMGVATNATKSDVIAEVYRGQEVVLPLVIGKDVETASVWIDFNNDGAAGNGENLAVNGGKVAVPADAAIGKTTAKVAYSDGTVITFSLALVEDITTARTVTVVAGANGTVAIEGADGFSVTNTQAVRMMATPHTGYNFEKWTDAAGNTVSNDNPFVYYGKEAATFTANFIQDKWGVVECNGAFSGDIAGYGQFIHNMTFAYYNRTPQTIFEATAAPAQIFNTVPGIIDVPKGASFTVKYDNGNKDGLKYCYLRAFIDLNADGDFDDEGELLKTVGTAGAQNVAVCSNSVNVLLPYDMPLGITHMRLRFDGAWDNSSNPAGNGAKAASIRPVYEIVINVTDKSDKAATIKVQSNNDAWGTVEVWTDETPGGSTGTEWVVSANIPMYLRATKASKDVEFLGWYDHYGRLFTTELEYCGMAVEDAVYTARFRRCLVVDGWEFDYRTLSDAQDKVVLCKVNMTGLHNLVLPAQVDILGNKCDIVGFDNNLFNGNKELFSITLPGTIEFLSVNGEASSAGEHDPFSGCINLEKISINGDCPNYYVGDDSCLYNSNGVLVSAPMGAYRKELAELIGKMETLTAQVATYDPAGKANKIALQVTNPNATNYLWANSVETSEGSIAHLIDGVKGNNSNFFHSNWHTVSTAEGYHFIEVDLGAESSITSMRFAYHTRTGCANDFPDAITVMGSNEKTTYTNVYAVSSGLPQAPGKSYVSEIFNCANPYRYLRFKVAAERTYWHMGEFELYHMTSTAAVFKQFEGTDLNNAFAAAMYDVLLSAVNVYNHGTTASQVTKAKEKLQNAYDELLAKVNDVTHVAGVVEDTGKGRSEIYNLAGCSLLQIDNPGVYVVNGKKVLVK
ncbi:MAG: alpha-N-acetylglucosaminidase C-terminal domain-containing protein [Bacteroidaceae bacterium]|nr:alpha-N-acetylglucosaminidase C-terminal domain-containing protein [Bacteroidaceae bacterium]